MIEDITYDSQTSGLVLGGAVGYEWWVAREWSIGMEGQLVTAFLNGSEDGVDSSLRWISPTFGAVFTYH